MCGWWQAGLLPLCLVREDEGEVRGGPGEGDQGILDTQNSMELL